MVEGFSEFIECLLADAEETVREDLEGLGLRKMIRYCGSVEKKKGGPWQRELIQDGEISGRVVAKDTVVGLRALM